MQLVPINKDVLRLEIKTFLLLKARSHKYIKRIPTGNQKKPYIYIYPGESKEDVLKKIGEAKQERGQDSTSKALFEKVSKEIKSIFPEADIETDYKDFNSKEKISKVEYGKIALTYFQNKEKYDEVAIKMKGLRAKKKPIEKKEKQPKEKKQLTPEQEEKRLAKNEYARKRRAVIKQLREKYDKKEEPKQESKEEPKQEQTKTEPDFSGGALFGMGSMPQSAFTQGDIFSKQQVQDSQRKDFKPTLVINDYNIGDITTKIKDSLIRNGKDKEAKEFIDKTLKADQDLEKVLEIASNYANIKKPYSDRDLAFKTIEAKQSLDKMRSDLSDTKRRYYDFVDSYIPHLRNNKDLDFKNSKELSSHLLNEFDEYEKKGKTSTGFNIEDEEKSNRIRNKKVEPVKTAYRKEGNAEDEEPKAPRKTIQDDETEKKRRGFGQEIPANKIKTKKQYTDRKDFDRPVIEGIKASIMKNGYDKSAPISIDQDNTVVDGHHRFTAISELIEEGKIPSDTPIPVIRKHYASEADRLLDQVSKNKNRRDVNVLDDSVAYKELLDAGKTPEEISQNTGESPERIKNVASLENLAPDIKRLLRTDFNSERKGGEKTGEETKRETIPQNIAIAIGKNGLNEDGKPNHSMQIKAFKWFQENRSKGVTASQISSYIRELKANQTGSFFKEEDTTSASQKEAKNIIGNEEKAKRNVDSISKMKNNIAKELNKVAGDNINNVNAKVMKEIAASMIALKGDSTTMINQLKATLRDFELLITGIEKASKEIEEDSKTPSFFGKSKYSKVKFAKESPETIQKLRKILIKMKLEIVKAESKKD